MVIVETSVSSEIHTSRGFSPVLPGDSSTSTIRSVCAIVTYGRPFWRISNLVTRVFKREDPGDKVGTSPIHWVAIDDHTNHRTSVLHLKIDPFPYTI